MSLTNSNLKKVDHSALKTNQAFIILFLVIAFIVNQPWIAAFVAAVMLLGTALGKPGFGLLYQRILKPLGWVRPDVLLDHPEPHRFAQGFGGVVLVASTAALFIGSGLLGWALTWLVIGLAALNLFAGFCAGCAVYYWLHRLNVPGFVQAPPEGSFPGTRSHQRAS
jgi:MFS family permease